MLALAPGPAGAGRLTPADAPGRNQAAALALNLRHAAAGAETQRSIDHPEIVNSQQAEKAAKDLRHWTRPGSADRSAERPAIIPPNRPRKSPHGSPGPAPAPAPAPGPAPPGAGGYRRGACAIDADTIEMHGTRVRQGRPALAGAN